MNKTFKVVSLGLLTTVALSSTSVNADCIGSGFGVGVTLSARQQKITFNDKNIKKAHENARNGLKDKLKEAIAATQSKFSKPNDASTKVVGTNEVVRKVDAYSEGDGGTNGTVGKIIGSNNNDWNKVDELSDKKTTLELKGTKFDSENPTKYRILTIDKNDPNQRKYNANGMIDANNGSYIEMQLIHVYPNLLKNNNIAIENPTEQSPSTNTTETKNYSKLTQTVNNNPTVYYIVPREQDFLSEIEAELKDGTLPTHAKWSDLFTDDANDKITEAFLDEIKDDSEYRGQFKNNELITDNNNVIKYINTVEHKDLGITDAIIDSAIGGSGGSDPNASKALSNTFKDVSKWSFDLGFNVFYQHRIFDWFIRAGLFGNFPIANRTISLVSNNNNNNNNNTDSKDKKSSKDDVSLTHSFDIGAQLLFGYNVTQSFALVFGGELGYSRYKLNNVNKLLSGYNMNSDNDNLVNWVAAGSTKEEVLKEYNNKLKEYGLSDKDKEKSFNKFFWRLIAGVEFNVGKCIVGLHGFFGPNTSLMDSKNKKDFGDLKVVNGGVRASIAFKF